jgi:hypothetical protein
MKVSKMITAVGAEKLNMLGKDRVKYREETYQRLKTGRIYMLDPNKKFVSRSIGQPVQISPA